MTFHRAAPSKRGFELISEAWIAMSRPKRDDRVELARSLWNQNEERREPRLKRKSQATHRQRSTMQQVTRERRNPG
jgi:hypothetical protein